MDGEKYRMFVVYDDSPADMGQLEYVLRYNDCGWDEFCRRTRCGRSFDPKVHAGIVTMGGWAAAPGEKKWVRTAMKDRAVLGICQGAQDLAAMLKCKPCKPRVDGEPTDRGLVRLSRSEEGRHDRLLKHLRDDVRMCQHHCWYFEPSDKVTRLAESPDTDPPHCDAFRLNDRVYGLQFHPEVPNSVVASWDGRATQAEALEVARVGWKVLDAWVEMAIENWKFEMRC